MENPTHTSNFRGSCKGGINIFLVPIKISLFFWIGGDRIAATFMPVYLKHQGLTITHLSTIITISVVFQFLISVMSGMLADRIGRLRPILFIHASFYFATLICFIIMPKVDKCVTKNITLNCVDNEIPHFSTRDSCEIFQEDFYTDACSVIYNGSAIYDDKNKKCTPISLLQKENTSIQKSYLNETSDFCLYQVKFIGNLTKDNSSCETTDCKSFQIICSDDDPGFCHYKRIIWIVIYGTLVVLYNTSRTIVHRFFDVISADLANQYNSDFGRQRLWSILGSIAGPALAGLVLDKTSLFGSENRYVPVFICAIIFVIVSISVVCKVNPKFHKPAANVCKKSFELVKDFEIFLFCVLLLTTGISFGFQMNYGNWYLQDLGASDLLLGVSKGVAALCALPFFYVSKWLINKVGVRNFFVISLFSYVFYCFAFSLMREPLLAPCFELANISAYYLFWVAVMHYCGEVAPDELQATMKAVSGTLHFNVGKIGAAVLGGYIMSYYGGRMAYKVLGCITLGYAVIYGTFLIIQRLCKKEVGVQLNWDDDETYMRMRQNLADRKESIIVPKLSSDNEFITKGKK